MDSLLFAINAIAPIVLMVLIGYLLKKLKLIDGNFTKTTNKLVFNVFMPVMLFLNIYNIKDLSTQDFTYMWYIICFVILVLLFTRFKGKCIAKKYICKAKKRHESKCNRNVTSLFWFCNKIRCSERSLPTISK